MTSPVRLEGSCGECLLYGAIQGLADGLVLVDGQGRIFHLNRRAEELLGVIGPRVLGTRLRACLKHQGLSAFWATAFREADPVTTEITLPSGASIRAVVSACRSSAGKRIGTALLLHDVTREKRIRVELSTSVAKRLVEMAGGEGPDGDFPPLTRREKEILRLVAGGLSNPAIAHRLHVTVNTVASHLKHLFPKIGVRSRSQAAAYAVARGIRPPAG